MPFAAALVVCLLLAGAVELAAQQRRIVLPAPVSMAVNSRDNVQIRCTFYPGGVIERQQRGQEEKELSSKPGKEVVPIILLHDWEGRRGDYDSLATYLQRHGHAVIVPDLRGHGESTTRRQPTGGEQTLNRDRMTAGEMQAMVGDLDAIKKFLMEKNNAGELNIEQLCVVGAGVGATLAMNWAMHDWSWPQLPTYKQGRDVKAIVLLSPRQSFKGLNVNNPLRHAGIQTALSIMIVVGKEDRGSYSDAKSIHTRLLRHRQEYTDPKEIAERQDLFLFEEETSLSGSRLIDPRARLPVQQRIARFIENRLVNRQDRFTWNERKSPLQ